MSARLTSSPAIAIWERAIQPSKRSLDEGAARALLAFRLSKRDLDRADMLASRAAKGKMSPAEAAELESYRTVSATLEFLKSKARRSLAKAG